MAGDELSETFAALADPTRRAILARLARGDATVKQLAKPFPISGPAISKHLRVLERAHLITRGRDRQSRPRHLTPAPIQEVAAWAERYRDLWESSFDDLFDSFPGLQDWVRRHAGGKPGGQDRSR